MALDSCVNSYRTSYWACSCILHFRVARYSVVYLVHLPSFLLLLITNPIRTQGDPRWYARSQPHLLPGHFPPSSSNATLTSFLQTYSYSRHFISTCVRVCGYESTSTVPPKGDTARVMGIDVEGHVTAVMHCPVGVDAERVGRDV
jgi:hypothetical protein